MTILQDLAVYLKNICSHQFKFMKKNLLLLLFAACFVEVQAQKALARITQPASLAGNIDFALAEFGGLLDMPLELQGILSQPNEGCSALTNAAAVAGKIAILDRGTCLMDEKCLRAQQAGAALVIVINNRVGPPFPMPAANVANQITVPCIMVTQADGNRIKEAINGGSEVWFSIGPIPPQNVDLRVNSFERIFNPEAGTYPIGQLRAEGDFLFYPGMLITNDGISTASNVKSHSTVSFGGNTIYDEISTDQVNLEPDSSVFLFNNPAELNSINKGVGTYDIRYTTSSDSAELYDVDNKGNNTFYITNNAFCKGRWNPITNSPLITQYYTIGTPTGYFELMSLFRLPYSHSSTAVGYSIDSLVFGVATNAPNLAGLTMEGYIYKWNDLNTDGDITNDEIELAAAGSYTFPNNYNSAFADVRLNLENFVGDQPHYCVTGSNELYIASVKYVGPEVVFFGFDEGFDYNGMVAYRNFNNTQDWEMYPYLQVSTAGSGVVDFEGAGLFSATTGYTGFNGIFWASSATGVILGESTACPVGNKDVLDDTKLQVNIYPNPANQYLRADLKFATPIKEITYHIMDINGRLIDIKTDQEGQEFHPKFDVSKLPSGQYILKIQTEIGLRKLNFTVAH
jgi:hypothetical protein